MCEKVLLYSFSDDSRESLNLRFIVSSPFEHFDMGCFDILRHKKLGLGNNVTRSITHLAKWVS